MMQVNIETNNQREIQVGDLLVIHDIDADQLIHRYVVEYAAYYAVVDIVSGNVFDDFVTLYSIVDYYNDRIHYQIIEIIPGDELEVRRVCK